MASSGWQGAQYITTIGTYSGRNVDYYSNLNITSISHTGTTLNVSGQISGYSSYVWGSYPYAVTVTPSGGSAITMFAANERITTTAKTVNFSVSISNVAASATSYNFTVRYYCYYNIDTTKTWTLNFDPSASAPTGLAVANLSSTDTSITGTVSVTGWGTGGSSYRKELQVWTYSSSGLVEPRRYEANNTSELSSVITVNNQSSGGGLILVPNTEYVIGIYAYNGAVAAGSTRVDTAVTKPAALVAKSATKISDSIVNISYVADADGGKYTRKVQYSLDETTWIDGDTIPTSGVHSGSFNVSSVPQSGATIYLRVTTSAGSTPSGHVTIQGKSGAPTRFTYGSIEEKSRDILKMYASKNDKTVKVTKIYASENGKTKLISQFFS